MALIFLLSAQPGLRFTDEPGTDLPLRRAAHLVVYGVLAVALLRPFSHLSARDAAIAAVVVATLWGIADELHQAAVPDRNGAPEDVLVDAVGATLGIIAWRLLGQRRDRRDRYLRSRGR